MNDKTKNSVVNHPTKRTASNARTQDRENLARALRTNQMLREQAREQINPTNLLTEIDEIATKLMPSKDLNGNIIPPEPAITQALKAQADIKFKLLGKVLPDLKATESISHATHDHQHQHVHTKVSSMEIAQRLQLWRREHINEPAAQTLQAQAGNNSNNSNPDIIGTGVPIPDTDNGFDINEFLA